MAPDLTDGTIAICSRSAAWAKGDIVVVWFPFGVITQDGMPIRTLIRRLAMVPPDITFPFAQHPDSGADLLVMLAANDRPDKLMAFRCQDILAIHQVIGVQQDFERGSR